MDLIQEVNKLISKIAGKASSTIILPTAPPQHPFAAGVSVEQIISEINVLKKQIQDFLSSIDQTNRGFNYSEIQSSNLNLKFLNAFVKSYVDAGGPCTYKFIEQLYDFIKKIDADLIEQEKRIKELNSANDRKGICFGKNLLEKIQKHI